MRYFLTLHSPMSGSKDYHKILTVLRTINSKWQSLGIALELGYSTLEEIEANNPNNVESCMAKVIARWLDARSSPLTWETLCDALRSDLVDCPVLAQDIEEKYCV